MGRCYNAQYRKVPRLSDTRLLSCNHPKTGKKRFYQRVMHPKDVDSIANSEDPDQTAPLGAVSSGSALFAQTNLSENLGSLRHSGNFCTTAHYQLQAEMVNCYS